MMRALLQDLRFGIRTLVRDRSFTIVALLTLALGIGATTAMFSLLDAVLFRPLPFRHPERLVELYEDFSRQGFLHNAVTPGTYKDAKARSNTFEDVAAIDTHADNLVTQNGTPEGVISGEVTQNLFPMLGVCPLLGRTFSAQEDMPGNNRVLILSYPLWIRRFAADPDIVGKTTHLSDVAYTVVGVMPRGFAFPSHEVDLWRPRGFTAEDLGRHGEHYLQVVARLRSGISLETANADMQLLEDQTVRQYPGEEGVGLSRFFVESLQQSYTRDVSRSFTMLMVAVAFLLLIACANVANLLLSRAVGRRSEIAMRVALGASRRRIVQQLLTESFVLGIVGCALGIILSVLSSALLKNLIPEDLSPMVRLRLNLPVLAFSILVSLASSFLFGLAPALASSSASPVEAIKEKRTSLSNRRISSLFVIGEVSLSLMLLIGASLLLESLWNLQHVDPGFRSDHLLTGTFNMSEPKYREFAERTRFFEHVLEAVRALPGVRSAGLTSVLPFQWKGGVAIITLENSNMTSEVPYNVNQRVITPGYFETLKIPLIQGRLFDSHDRQDAPLVAIVNQTMARKLWPNQNAIGKRFKMGRQGSSLPWIQTVGVVGDVTQMGLSEPSRQEVYLPYLQASGNWMRPNSIAVRTSAEPMSMLRDMQHAISGVDPGEPLNHTQTMDGILDHEIVQNKIQALLLGGLASLALIMACVGIYGVMAYMVGRRTSEMGVRMALGAKRGQILGIVLRQGMTVTGIGILVGMGGATLSMRLMTALFFGVSPTNPVILLGVSGLIILAALLACFAPAWRAASIDPVQALRTE